MTSGSGMAHGLALAATLCKPGVTVTVQFGGMARQSGALTAGNGSANAFVGVAGGQAARRWRAPICGCTCTHVPIARQFHVPGQMPANAQPLKLICQSRGLLSWPGFGLHIYRQHQLPQLLSCPPGRQAQMQRSCNAAACAAHAEASSAACRSARSRRSAMR